MRGFSYCISDEKFWFWFSNWASMERLSRKVDFVNILDTHLTLRKVSSNGCWKWNVLMTNVPFVVFQFVDQHPPPVTYDDERHDMLIWNDFKIGVYACKFGYDWLLTHNIT